MAARRTDLVKRNGSQVPGTREDRTPGSAVELLDSTQQLVLSPGDLPAEPPDAHDVATEIAAPPRRKLPWLPLLIVAGAISGAAFAGGALVEKHNTSGTAGAASAFAKLGSSSAASGAGAATKGTGAAAGGGFGAGGTAAGGATGGATTTGTVKVVEGDTIYLSTSSGNIVKVTAGSSTSVSVAKAGSVSQLLPGQTVTVQGTTDSSGAVAATSVTQSGTTGTGTGAGGG